MLARLFVFAFVILCFNIPVHAAWLDKLDIDSVSVRALGDTVASEPTKVENDCSGLNGPGMASELSPEIEWDQIWRLGEKIWQIIEDGQPVVNMATPPLAHALPRGLTCWADLERWQPPRHTHFEVAYKNGFGMEVVRLRVRVQFTHGGGHDGRGRYLANVTMLPEDVHVIWGYRLDASVDVGQAINLGTSSDPLAGLELNLKWMVKTPVKESRSSVQFFIQGDGVVRASEAPGQVFAF